MNLVANKVAGTQNFNFFKKRLHHRLFPVKLAKFLRTRCFTEYLQWLLLTVSGFQPTTLLKKRLQQRCFSVNFAKFLRTSFLLTEHLWMTALCLFMNFEKFSVHFFYKAFLGNCLFHVQAAEFQPADTV